MNAKWKENACKWKEDERKWKQKMTFVDSRPRMLSHPQKAGNFTLLVYRELTTWENDKRKQTKKVIWGHLRRCRVFLIQPQVAFSIGLYHLLSILITQNHDLSEILAGIGWRLWVRPRSSSWSPPRGFPRGRSSRCGRGHCAKAVVGDPREMGIYGGTRPGKHTKSELENGYLQWVFPWKMVIYLIVMLCKRLPEVSTWS